MPAKTHDPLPPEIERELAAIDAALAGDSVDPDLSDLAVLARDLRDERPEVDPFFVRELDLRAAGGFPGKRGAGRFARIFRAHPMAIPGVAASMLLALVVSVSVIGGTRDEMITDNLESAGEARSPVASSDLDESTAGGGTSTTGPAGGSAEPAPVVQSKARRARQYSRPTPPAAGSANLEDSSAGGGSLPVASPPPAAGRRSPRSDGRVNRLIERSASLTLTAKPRDIEKVSLAVADVAYGAGGFVVTSNVSSSTGGGGGTFELRVPAERLNGVMAALSRLGKVSERAQKVDDITAQGASARERLSDARAERKGLLRALARASTQAEIDSIKARLRDASSRISTAKADLARVNNRASFSTVVVTLVADGSEPVEEEDDGVWSPADAANDALRILEVAAGVILVSAAVLLPMALLAFLAALALRWSGRRRREHTLDTA